ncbi:MAG: hypothetical protein AAFY88_26380, partial [Acidobacteriota bacterium]
LGGGAGAGTSNNAGPGHGGIGGGIAFIRANTMINDMTLRSNGTQPPDSRQDGAGGGGAGGTISVGACDAIAGAITAVADGGDGGDVDWNVGDFHGPGGGGGGGVVLSTVPLASVSVAGGAPGISPSANNFGATSGAAGDVDSAIAVAAPGASPGCVCLATAALVIEPRLESVDGVPHFAWSTSSQAGTVGFEVLRDVDGEWRPVTPELVPATVAPATRSRYRVEDADVPRTGASRYLILEWDTQGRRIPHGPYAVSPETAKSTAAFDGGWPLGRDENVEPPRLKSFGSDSSSTTQDLVDGPGPASLHLEIEETGWYQLSADALAEHFGVELPLARRWIKGGQLALENLGEPVAWVRDAGTGSLLFFGEGPGALPTAWAEVAPANVYRLTPARGVVAHRVDARPFSSTVAPATFLDAVNFERQVFPATLAATDP